MNTHADKTQKNKRQSVSNGESQMQRGSESTFQFVDNRPEAVAQRKLQEMTNNSPQAKQAAQLQAMADNYSAGQQQPIQKKVNNTGLSDNLKSGIENLSGYSMDDVKVHRNSDKPAQLQAHAYAQGADIHLGPGQEKHLPHEAWHVVQQKQGRVKPTLQMKGGVNVNDNVGLEKEADVMGAKAIQLKSTGDFTPEFDQSNIETTIQLAKYSVYRKLPLESTLNETDSDTAIKRVKYALRLKYPGETDEERGDDYKAELLNALFAIGKSDPAPLIKAHVANINKEPRKRSGNMAKGINKLESAYMSNEVKWIGAHLVKDQWGGEDNLWNVVAWPQETEDDWAKRFEEPIDQLFLRGEINNVIIEIHVVKEDEALMENSVHQVVDNEISRIGGNPRIDTHGNVIIEPMHLKGIDLVKGKVEKKRWEVNKSVEAVPYNVTAKSTLTPRFSLGFGDTKWMHAQVAALFAIDDEINKSIEEVKKGVHPKALENAKSKDAIKEKENEKRLKERKKAHDEESRNLKPTINEMDL